jgi:hypothetical protein
VNGQWPDISSLFLQVYLWVSPNLDLSDRVMEGVRAASYTVPTPIQTLAIRPLLAGRDIIAGAQTGTGKTAAFVLPILHRLSLDEGRQGAHRRPRALVLTPTRELALQVQLAASAYGRFLPLTTASIYGGVGMDAQVKQLRRRVDIVAATPGRLLDHLQHRSIDLSEIESSFSTRLIACSIWDSFAMCGRSSTRFEGAPDDALLGDDLSRHQRPCRGIQRSPDRRVGERRNPAETVRQHFYSGPARFED